MVVPWGEGGRQGIITVLSPTLGEEEEAEEEEEEAEEGAWGLGWEGGRTQV